MQKVFAAATCLFVVAGAESGKVTFNRGPDRVEVLLNGQPVTAFRFNPKWDKPFLYPIRTLSGTVISRGYPVESRPGEEQDHAWHRGIWYGHGDVNGEDFWREKADGTTSRLVMDGEPKTSANTLDVRLAMMTPKGKRLGTIRETYAFSRDGPNLLIDSTISVIANGGEALRFGDTDDGGFAVRLSDDFRQDRGAELINSEGLTGTENIWGRPARWVKYSAKINGRSTGVAILDHPSNLRSPTGWHARRYSLNAANPFATGSFARKKNPAEGAWTLPAGETLTLRYLLIIHDGELNPAGVERYFQTFAKDQR